MFILISNPESGVHLFTSETFAVEALVLAGKDFLEKFREEGLKPPAVDSPEQKLVFENEIKEMLNELDKVQTVDMFNSLIRKFEKTSLCKTIKRKIYEYRFKQEKLVSVFFLPYEDEEGIMFYTSIVVPNWELKEVTENNLLTDSLTVLKNEFF